MGVRILGQNFWLGCLGIFKAYLAEKSKIVCKITLIGDNQIISQDRQIAKMFNKYFINI